MTQSMKTGHKGPCLRCGKVRRLTRDHVVPRITLRRNGLRSPACNIQPLCGPCNGAKGEAAVDYRAPGRRLELRHWLAENGASHIEVLVGKPLQQEEPMQEGWTHFHSFPDGLDRRQVLLGLRDHLGVPVGPERPDAPREGMLWLDKNMELWAWLRKSPEDAAGAPEDSGVGEDTHEPLTATEHASLEALMAAIEDPSRGLLTPGLSSIHLPDYDALQQRFNTILHASLVDLLDRLADEGEVSNEMAADSIMTMLGEVARLTTDTRRKVYEEALRRHRGEVSIATEGPGGRLEE